MKRWRSGSLILVIGISSSVPLLASADTTWEAADNILGRPGRVLAGDVHKYGWPRTDLKVSVGGLLVEPTLALGSWAALFRTSGESQVMAVGDLVLLAPEVSPVVRALQAGGLDILAIHNHLIGESPQVIYVHFGGHGELGAVAKALRSALDTTATPLVPPPGATPSLSPAETAIFDQMQTLLGRKGSMAGRVLQVSVARAARIEEDGMPMPPGAGMTTALNFQIVDSRVATTGDFVLVAEEVNPVIRELGARSIQATALHSHMLKEQPRLFFLHFWGLAEPAKIAEGLKAALAKVATQ